MVQRLFSALLAATLVILVFSCQPASAATRRRRHVNKPLFACAYRPAFREIPCTEVDRAVHEAATEFGVNETSFRKLVACESSFDPYAGRRYRGLLQQSVRYWPGRVQSFNSQTGFVRVPGGITSPFDNARVSAWMLSQGLRRHWTC